MIKLTDMKLNVFLDELASQSPAPGGGSVAALSGALGAALTSMVCNLTIGKENYERVQKDIKELLLRSEQLRKQLTELIEKDTEAFNEVIKALRLPKDNDEQKEKRRQALQKAFKNAASVPLETARTCEKVLDVTQIAAEKGNKNSITDAAVSALMAQAGIKAAILNVKINLGSIKDNEFVQQTSSELTELQRVTSEKTTKILTIVEQSL
jgi:formiminotetrahydrofolate cyclodeaminase